jgi:hypothetical protein
MERQNQNSFKWRNKRGGETLKDEIDRLKEGLLFISRLIAHQTLVALNVAPFVFPLRSTN